MSLNSHTDREAGAKTVPDTEESLLETLTNFEETPEEDPVRERRKAATILKLATLYKRSERYEEAETRYREALYIYQRLENHDYGEFHPLSALVEKNLATLAEIRAEEKARSSIEARMERAARSRDAAGEFYRARRYEDSEREYVAAVELYRDLAKEDGATFNANLAKTLGELAIVHQLLQRFFESENEYREALTLYRDLARRRPETNARRLAKMLFSFANYHARQNRRDDAAQELTEALANFRIAAKYDPEAHRPYLDRVVGAMLELGVPIPEEAPESAPNEIPEVVEVAESNETPAPFVFVETSQVVEVDSTLAAPDETLVAEPTRPVDAEAIKRADALVESADAQFDRGRYIEAERDYQSALEIYREQATNDREFLFDVATTLNNIASLHFRQYRYADAERGYREAWEIFTEMAKRNPDYRPDLANSTLNLAALFESTGRPDDASRAYQDAVAIYRALDRDKPGEFRRDLIDALNRSSELHFNTRQFVDAEKERREAQDLARNQ